MQLDDNQPRNDDDNSQLQVEHTNGLYCVYVHVQDSYCCVYETLKW